MSRSQATDDTELAARLHQDIAAVKKEIAKVIIGQDDIIEQILIALLSRGHCLLVGVPGLAKTLLIRTLAASLDLQFGRVQFTPDLMPSDITGTELVEEDAITKKREFRFIPGPVFTNVLLADEINRTPPKTQSALLEAMQEHRVTVGGKSYTLKEPFFVLATQNPIEQEGTYPLPEAQLDRFMFNLWVDYPSYEEEKLIVASTTGALEPTLNQIIDGVRLMEYQDLLKRVPVTDQVIDYAVALTTKTRPQNDKAPDIVKSMVRWGAGPRASQFLVLAAKAKAILDGRFSPNNDDIRFAMIPVLRHRIITNFNADAEGITPVDIINKIV